MKRVLRNSALALFAAVLGACVAGCETVRPHGFAMWPIEDYGSGGGDSQ